MASNHNRKPADEMYKQIARLFNTSTSDRRVGESPFASDFFSEYGPGAQYQSESAAERGRILREAAWRLIESHNKKYHPNQETAVCSYEKCAKCSNLSQWHFMTLRFAWDRDQGMQKPNTVNQLRDMRNRVADPKGIVQRERLQQPPSKRKQRAGSPADDPVIQRSRDWQQRARNSVLNALCAHLCDPEDPVVLKMLKELQDPLSEPPARQTHSRASIPPAPLPAPMPEPTSSEAPAGSLAGSPADVPNLPLVAPPPDAPERDYPPLPSWTESPRLTESDWPTLPDRQAEMHVSITLPDWIERHWRRAFSISAAVTVLLACLLQAGIPAASTTLTWSAAGLSGWLVARQSVSRVPRILSVMNLHTGAWRPLWPPLPNGEGQSFDPNGPPPPPSSDEGQGVDPHKLAGTNSPTSPSFTPAGHRLAFIANDSNQVAAIFVATLVVGSDGWPTFTTGGPQLLMECSCSTLTWTPSGQWLIYNSPDGMRAVSANGKDSRAITNGHDSFPACSPDGRYLAYQRERGGIVALPTHDCLPDGSATQRMRFLSGYSPAWNPSWSPDSKALGFVSNVTGRTAVYVVPFVNLTDHLKLLVRDTAQIINDAGCGNPVWAQRVAHSGIQVSPALVYGCDLPTPSDHHGTLGANSGLTWPQWTTSLSEDIVNRDSLCWIPDNLRG